MIGLDVHLPRIEIICKTFDLDSDYIAAEDVLNERSRRHCAYLAQRLNAETQPRYAFRVEREQIKCRALRGFPGYWLYVLALMDDMARVRRIMQRHAADYLSAHGVYIASMNDAALKAWLYALKREFPSF